MNEKKIENLNKGIDKMAWNFPNIGERHKVRFKNLGKAQIEQIQGHSYETIKF